MEESGRLLRYEFFRTICRSLGCRKIVLGHTADDQVETMLLFLIRGAGKKGMAAMSEIAPLSQDPSISIVRPFIQIWKKEILRYLRANRYKFRTDRTNLSNLFLRNRVRNQLLPFLSKFNPKVKERLLSLSGIFESDEKLLRELALQFLKREAAFSPKGFIMPARAYRALPLALQARVFQQMVLLLKGDLKKIGYNHFKNILKIVGVEGSDAAVALPDELVLKKSGGQYYLSKTASKARQDFHCSLKVPGTTIWEPTGQRIQATFRGQKGNGNKKKFYLERFDTKEIKMPLELRSWKQGDKIRPFGLEGHQKIQDLLMDHKIGREQRRVWPILVDANGEILWVVGLRRSEAGRVTQKTMKILSLSVQGKQ